MVSTGLRHWFKALFDQETRKATAHAAIKYLRCIRVTGKTWFIAPADTSLNKGGTEMRSSSFPYHQSFFSHSNKRQVSISGVDDHLTGLSINQLGLEIQRFKTFL